MATYSGRISEIRTFDIEGNHTSMFARGEQVELRVYYQVTRYDGWSEQIWRAKIRAFDDQNRKLGEKSESFFTAPWTYADTNPKNFWEEPLVIKFSMPNHDMVAMVELYAGQALAGETEENLVDRAYFALLLPVVTPPDADGEPKPEASKMIPIIVGGTLLIIGAFVASRRKT